MIMGALGAFSTFGGRRVSSWANAASCIPHSVIAAAIAAPRRAIMLLARDRKALGKALLMHNATHRTLIRSSKNAFLMTIVRSQRIMDRR